MTSIRWAFNVSKWEPSEKEFLLALSCLQAEEKNRIQKYVFKKDIKASIAGRLMIRKFVNQITGKPYDSIILSRTINNKPVYKIDESDNYEVSFNISHHGSYTVLAGEIGNIKVGVDVMKLEYRGGKSLDEFFRIMNKNFSISEWTKIKGTNTTSNQDKIINFCRNWALKESYVKALGTGLSMDLRKLNFGICSNLQQNKVILDTCLYINHQKQSWIFEESLLDEFHCVVVALEKKNRSSLNSSDFRIINSIELLENAIPLLPQDFEYCKKYFLNDPLQ